MFTLKAFKFTNFVITQKTSDLGQFTIDKFVECLISRNKKNKKTYDHHKAAKESLYLNKEQF
jgi:hypothetical protein